MGFWKRFFNKSDTIVASAEEEKVFHLYLIDDDEMIRKTFELYYKNYASKPALNNFPATLKIQTFSNSQELMKQIKDTIPGLLLVDYYLASDDEYSSGNELRETILKEYPSIRIAMLSGMEDESKVFQLIQKGVRDYVIKNDEMYDNVNVLLIETVN